MLHKNITGADLHIPATHSSSHEDDGSDELNIEGLSGVAGDKQNPKFTHSDIIMSPDGLPSIFQLLYNLEARLSSIESKISILSAEAKRANTNFDLDNRF